MLQKSTNSTYKIVAKYRNGKEITYYQVEDSVGVKRKISKGQLCFLIGAGLISNYYLTFFQDKPILRSNTDNNESLPEYLDTANKKQKKYKISKELILNGKTIGFEVTYDSKSVKLKLDDIYKLINTCNIQGVYINDEDKNVINFENEQDLYSLEICDITTLNNIPRINVLYEANTDSVEPKEVRFTAIGKLENIAFEDDVMVLKKDVIVEINSFSYANFKILDISKHSIRIGNSDSIFDIRLKEDITKSKRQDIFNIIAEVIKKYDINSDEVIVKVKNNSSQELGCYTYRLK